MLLIKDIFPNTNPLSCTCTGLIRHIGILWRAEATDPHRTQEGSTPSPEAQASMMIIDDDVTIDPECCCLSVTASHSA